MTEITNTQNFNPINPINYFDNLIQLKIINVFDKLSKKYSIKNFILLILLFGSESIKKYVLEFMNKILKKINNINYVLLFNNFINKFKQKKINTNYEIINYNSTNIIFNPKDCFYFNLYNYIINNNNNVEYNKINKEIIQINNNEYNIRQEWTNIIIKTNNIKINFNITIEYYINFQSKKIYNYKLINNNNITRNELISNCTITNTITNLFLLLPYKLFLIDFFKNKKKSESVNSNGFITHLLKKAKLDKCFNCDDLIQIFCYLYKKECCIDNKYYLYKIFNKKKITLFKKSIELDFLPTKDYYVIIKNGNNINLRQTKEVKAWFDNQLNNEICENCENSNIINLQSDNESIDLIYEFNTFISSLNQNKNINNKIGSNINIYDININREEKVIKNGTPEQIIENDDKTKSIIKSIPDKIDIIKSVKIDLINEIYKNFDTLYLKKNDSSTLNNILHNFKNKKDMYKQLGLPYKFGALLYGEPGTGKSSAIMAISSYLQRDVYYINLNDIKDNKELKMIFKYINKELSKNGIIVMEDIDVMSDIVNIRDNKTSTDELTLECVLNLLQGSLTIDGTMFIVTTNSIDKLDPAFYRDGRFDVKIHLNACDHYQMNLIYNKFFNRDIPDKILQKIPEFKITPATFISNILKFYLTNNSDENILNWCFN